MNTEPSEVGPIIASDACVASSAVISGDVHLGSGCVIDEGAMIVASGGPIDIGARVVVMPGAVIRSTGGSGRPSHGVAIGADSLIGPQAALAGCTLGEAVYAATQVMVFHGANVGDGCRLGAGSIVHTKAHLPARTRVGMRQMAVPDPDGGPAVVTGNLDTARELLAKADFFGGVFAMGSDRKADLLDLHRQSTRVVASEVRQRIMLAPDGRRGGGAGRGADGAG